MFRTLLITLVLGVLTFVPLRAENGKNSMICTYDDGKYVHVAVEELEKLRRGKSRYVGCFVHRLEPGNNVPKLTNFNGRERLAITLVPAVDPAVDPDPTIVFIEVDLPPATKFAQECSLKLNVAPVFVVDEDLPDPPESNLSAMTVVLISKLFTDSNYDAMVACHTDEVRLQSQVIPATGEFFDTTTGLCLFP